MKKILLIFLILIFIFTNLCVAQEDVRLLRFPAIYENQVVFSYAGDLYTVSANGGKARKLTNDEKGYEIFPRFSPDGKYIAFTGQYDGNTEVYLIPSQGGIPKRLTHTATLGRDDISDRMGPNNIVMTWVDNEHIIYRSRKQSFNSFIGQLFKISIHGGLSKELPLPEGSWCSFLINENKMAFNRVFREFRTWKYYKGGMADDIWIHDFNTKKTSNITKNDYQDIFPMWVNNKIYFLSDRDRIMNLFVYDIITKKTSKLTHYDKYDIKFPSLGKRSIVYENGGYLYRYDLASGSMHKITVSISNDQTNARSKFVDASKYITSYAISPSGQRVVFGARGDIFTIPKKSGVTRNITQSSGVHDRNVEWSPNGKYISFISDRTGEDEIYIQLQDGSKPAIQITKNSDTYKYNPIWSPDSKKLLWSDKMGRLNIVEISSKKQTVVAKADAWEIRSYSWSPDSRWIAYALPKVRAVNTIMIYDTHSDNSYQVTDNWYNASYPVFDTKGKYLFFTSYRDFNPTRSWAEHNHAYIDMAGIYFVTLEKKTQSPFQLENNEVDIKEKKKTEEAKEENKEENKEINIDVDGISGRVVKLPIKAGDYRNSTVIGNKVYYIFNSSKSESSHLKMYDLKDKKETDLGKANAFIISADSKKMFLKIDGKYTIIDLPKTKISPEKYLNLSTMKVKVDFTKEWEQIFMEAWRQMRDFFYVPNMHGVNWLSIKKKYAPLLPYVKNRNDLNYIIGEMIAELNVGHAYISGGDKPKPTRISTGLLGAKISKDVSGYFKIDKILQGENWNPKTRSPLTEVGVDVNEGDFIIAVDGISVKTTSDIYELLLNKANKQVILRIHSSADEDGAHDVIVKPIGDESRLYYLDWVKSNIKKVNEATNGQVGYIHIPDMGTFGLNEFAKHFYPQLNKKGLIIDDRGNGGGNVSPMIIERLNRKLAIFGMSRNNNVRTKPSQMMLGPKVMLINKYSASDGDLFPYQFKKLGMGTVIGMRSWGGVVGIRSSLPFIDGGDLRKPEFGHFDEHHKWVIEGHGVEPDITIDNDPAKEYVGEDEQLNKAIQVILEQIKDVKTPTVPKKFPDKSK